MKSTDNRTLFGTPIGASAAAGNIAAIPQTQAHAGDGTASVALGFPPETFIARAAGGEPPRGQDMNGLLNLLSSALQVLQAGYFGPFDAGFAQSIGGYPAGAIVAGALPGTFWVSTAEANVSTPGADGAAWQSLFNGYATQVWSNAQFLQLALTTLQTVTGPVAFGGKTTVPDITVFNGKDALNAETADGRYPASVPTTGQTRVSSLVQDANGRTLSNGTALANLTDVATSGTSSSGFWFKIGTKLVQTFLVNNAYDNKVVTFPIAYNPDATIAPRMIGGVAAVLYNSSGWVELRGPQSEYPNSGVTYSNITLGVSWQSGANGGGVASGTGVDAYITIIGDVG